MKTHGEINAEEYCSGNMKERDYFGDLRIDGREMLKRNTGYIQKNGAVSKVNKKCISYHTRAQHTLSAAGTV
jgi:hypothetical protein